MSELKQALLEELLSSQELSTWSPYEHKFFGDTTRALSFFGEVSGEKAELFISQLFHLEKLNDEEPITVYLNTEGGSLTDGLAIYDAIKTVSCPVILVTTGLCSSAGLIILSAADYRIATPTTTFFYHQPVVHSGSIDSIDGMKSFAHYYEHCQKVADKIIRERTEMKKSVWNLNFKNKTSFYFSTQEALDFNLIDSVMDSRKYEVSFEKDEEDDE